MSIRPVPAWIDHRSEQEVNYGYMHEFKKAINNLKNWKAPGTDGIPSELIIYIPDRGDFLKFWN